MTAAAGAAAAWGLSDFLAGMLARRRPVLTVLIGSRIAAMLLALAAVAVRGVLPEWDDRLWLADAAFLAAAVAALTPAAVVASLYPAVTLLLNRSLLRERLHTVHHYGVVAAIFAVACLAR